MKILCVSDYIDPLIYSNGAKKNFPDIDLILCAGDLPMDYIDFIVTVFNRPTYFVFGNHDLKEFKFYQGSHTQSSSIGNAAETLASQSFGTKGRDHGHGAVYVGFRAVSSVLKVPHPSRKRHTPLLIAGASGSRNYNGGLCQYTDAQMKMQLVKMIPRLIYNRIVHGRFLDIFLTHATPLGFHDMDDPCHVGFPCFNWFLRTFKPALMVHGHIHLYDQRSERAGKLGGTIVANAYAHHVIELNMEETENETKEKL